MKERTAKIQSQVSDKFLVEVPWCQETRDKSDAENLGKTNDERDHQQNVQRYAPLKTSDPVGGRPDHFIVEKPTFSPKLMVFCGVN